ncbi:uncharacterized protein F5891DRAFT_1171755 [Suillus fuscotomentosus]|uniref:Uncharacterized protein n=1 Tax=Suillus fuscotomentosus TaxID=1912939 RepID=A0AAD4EBL8_9AGAM|nr:uncharacterized protein F5891DRAFT_1171755 [Suillus fuscotomentosus]KAG1903171.1 hypothetical protein F5891DRAFT_1171755 [Suillus fuscotomentosus]
MRFSFLAVIAALTASMSVSATPAVFSRDCSECCSGKCGYNYRCGGMCYPTDKNTEELLERETQNSTGITRRHEAGVQTYVSACIFPSNPWEGAKVSQNTLAGGDKLEVNA